MNGSPTHWHSNKITVYNGTGATISAGRGLTITKNASGDLGVALSAVDVRPNCFAIVDIPDTESGDAVLLNDCGIANLVASGAIAAGSTVTAAASGKISTGGSATVGKNIDAAAADGDIVRVLVS